MILRPRTRIRRRGLIGSLNLKNRRLFKRYSAALALFFVLALANVWVRIEVIETGYRLRRLEEEQERLKADTHALEVEQATLRSPRRLEEKARAMGLKRPREDQVVLLGGRR